MIDQFEKWQRGHDDGGERAPTSNDYIYVCGWIAGYCECHQSGGEEAEKAYLSTRLNESEHAWMIVSGGPVCTVCGINYANATDQCVKP